MISEKGILMKLKGALLGSWKNMDKRPPAQLNAVGKTEGN
jgi:hypothetical protein